MNKSIKTSIFSAILISMAGAAYARPMLSDASMDAAGVLPIDSIIHTGTLPNGFTYYIRYNNQTPGQADFYLANKVGSILEVPEQRGLAHFLEHMAFNGTKHFPGGNGAPNSVRAWSEKNGIKFGADLNAYTSIDETVYNISNAPVGKPGVADTCLLILRDWAGDMLLKPEEIDAERGVIKEEWRSRRSRFATSRMMEDAMAVIYSGTKYADCLPIGDMNVVDTFRYETLRNYYDDWYRPELQGVIVVGDVDVARTEQQIKTLFGSLENPVDAKPRVYYPIGDNDTTIVFMQADDEQPTLNFSIHMKRDADLPEARNLYNTYKEGYKSTLAMFILRQRLAELTKEAEPRIMSATVRDGAFYVTTEKDAFCLNIGLLPADPFTGIDAAIEVVEKARRYGFTESELEHAKIQNAVRYEHKRDTKDVTANGEYAKQILHHFLNGEPAMAIDYEADLIGRLNEEITLEDVNNALKDIVTDKNQVVMLFGPTSFDGSEYSLPDKDQLLERVSLAQNKDYPNDIKDTPIDPTFIKRLPKKGKIVSKREVENGYTEYLLSNGITVSARPSTLEPNRLTINMFRLGGESLYGDEDGINFKFLNKVVRESGASDFDNLTLQKKRKGKALRVTPYIEAEEEGVKGVCAASDFKTWLEVAYLYLTKPRKDDKIFKSIIGKQRSLLKNRDANPNVAYNDSLRSAIYGDSERTAPVTLDNIDMANLDRIYTIYKQRFANLAGMHLIVTGDIRTDEFEDLICQYVASLPGKPGKGTSPEVGANTTDIRRGQYTNVFRHELKTPSSLTNVVYSADLPYTAENDLKLSVLSQILRGVFTEKIREDKGGTYGVSVEGQFWKYPEDGCSMTINFRCAPESYNELIGVITDEIAKMAKDGPTASELNRVKEYECKNYDRAVLTNGWWEYVRYHQLRDGIDFNEDYIKNVENLTTDDIRRFCNDLVSANNRIEVTMQPL